MNIGLDIMGGDFAPLEAVKGVRQYLSEQNDSSHLTLVGDESQIKDILQQLQVPTKNISVVHAEQV
ncbi:MAG TPA: hypothetical protein VN958_08605, partial [Chitinophagaceae bacterium]|nr:hypothetical protein [Chitinophagaceae bacterium]